MLKFDKATHSYKNTFTDLEYTSATTLINKFKKKFDSDFYSKKIAEKEGISQKEVLERWNKINAVSKIRGSNIHSAIDVYNKTGDIDPEFKDILESLESIDLYNPKKSKCEELIYNHTYRIAGTADVIEDLGNTFNVYDFKTNKKFNLVSAYKSFLLEPLNHLSECEYNIYSLQLSLYAYMYHNMTGKIIGKLGIVYLDADNKFNVYYTPYLYSDIMKMLSYAKSAAA